MKCVLMGESLQLRDPMWLPQRRRPQPATARRAARIGARRLLAVHLMHREMEEQLKIPGECHSGLPKLLGKAILVPAEYLRLPRTLARSGRTPPKLHHPTVPNP